VETQSEPTALEAKHYFLVRRIHSLLGIVPVGVFVCFHLFANATILAPGEPGAQFQKGIEQIHALGPFLAPVEIIFIFLPLLFHALLGVKIWLTSSPNLQNYRYFSNARYTFQRVTGVLAFVFIMYHVWQMHWFGGPFGGGHFKLHSQAGTPTGALTTAQAIQASPWIMVAYLIGVSCTVFHLANGIWTALITWGITIRPATQRASGYVCAAFGIILGIVGIGAVIGFQNFDTQAMGAAITHQASSSSHAP